MVKPLSNDLRRRIVGSVSDGSSRRAAARRFGVADSTAIRLSKRFEDKGHWEPDKFGSKRSRSPLEAIRDELLALVGERPDLTLADIVAYAAEKHGVRTSDSSVDRFFKRHGVTFKKRRRTPASKTASM